MLQISGKKCYEKLLSRLKEVHGNVHGGDNGNDKRHLLSPEDLSDSNSYISGSYSEGYTNSLGNGMDVNWGANVGIVVLKNNVIGINYYYRF